jgi:lactoylglutathione lyase
VTSFREPFPIVKVEDVERAAAFYISTFGFDRTFGWPAEGEATFVFLTLDPLGIALAARAGDDDSGRDVDLWIYADDVDEAADRLRAAGAKEVLAPTDQPWGERMCSFRDPDGYLIHVGARV